MDKNDLETLRMVFETFDTERKDLIENDRISSILDTLGYTYDDSKLDEQICKEDKGGKGALTFEEFVKLAVIISEDEEADEVLQKELKEAFKLYDKEGNGFIPTSSLREILATLDDQLTSDQLSEMIAEIDTDSSGTVDFEEFYEFMTLEPDKDYYSGIDKQISKNMANCKKKKAVEGVSRSKGGLIITTYTETTSSAAADIHKKSK